MTKRPDMDLVAEHLAIHGVSAIPKKRSKPQPRVAKAIEGGFPITEITVLSAASREKSAPSAKGDRRTRAERRKAAESADAMAVALAQPHRRGNADPRAQEPLYQFCEAHKCAEFCYRAGALYEETLRQSKAARGFEVPGLSRGEGGILDEDEIEALREAAVLQEKKAQERLRMIMPRLPRAMERLCYDHLGPPSPYDEQIIKDGLVALAHDIYGLLDRGINADKAL